MVKSLYTNEENVTCFKINNIDEFIVIGERNVLTDLSIIKVYHNYSDQTENLGHNVFSFI